MEKSKVFGVPLVLLIHAFVLTCLLAIVFSLLLLRFVTQPLLRVDNRLHNLEVKSVVSVTPTASVSAVPTKALPTASVSRQRFTPPVNVVPTGK